MIEKGTLTCSRCHTTKNEAAFSSPKTCKSCSEKRKTYKKNHEKDKLWRVDNKEKLQSYMKDWRTSKKATVLHHYGKECACCGEKDIRFLTIDHIDGNGCAHRKKLGVNAGVQFYRWLIKNNYPNGYQVLCFNCNCGRSVNGGVCPHQSSSCFI